MTKQEFKEAFELAKTKENLLHEDIVIFDGFGLNGFDRVYCTIRQVARLIRWQCEYGDGTIDAEELQGIVNRGRYKFQIVG